MPPSGYNKKEAKILKSFVYSNVIRAREEAQDSGISFNENIQKEIHDITRALEQGTYESSQIGSLYLSYAIYEKLKKKDTGNLENTEAYIADALDEIVSEILDIHI